MKFSNVTRSVDLDLELICVLLYKIVIKKNCESKLAGCILSSDCFDLKISGGFLTAVTLTE